MIPTLKQWKDADKDEHDEVVLQFESWSGVNDTGSGSLVQSKQTEHTHNRIGVAQQWLIVLTILLEVELPLSNPETLCPNGMVVFDLMIFSPKKTCILIITDISDLSTNIN